MLFKGTKLYMLYHYMLLWAQTQMYQYCVCIKIRKLRLKNIRTEVQVKWCFFVIQIIIYSFLTYITWVYTQINIKIESSIKKWVFLRGGLEPKQNNCRNCVACYSWNNKHILIIVLHSLKGVRCSGLSFFNPKIYWETCTTNWVFLSSVLWSLLLTMFTVLSGTSQQMTGHRSCHQILQPMIGIRWFHWGWR